MHFARHTAGIGSSGSMPRAASAAKYLSALGDACRSFLTRRQGYRRTGMKTGDFHGDELATCVRKQNAQRR